jgi:hypothetical protein
MKMPVFKHQFSDQVFQDLDGSAVFKQLIYMHLKTPTQLGLKRLGTWWSSTERTSSFSNQNKAI